MNWADAPKAMQKRRREHGELLAFVAALPSAPAIPTLGAANLMRGADWRRAMTRSWSIAPGVNLFANAYGHGIRAGWFIGLPGNIIVDIDRAKARELLAALVEHRCDGRGPDGLLWCEKNPTPPAPIKFDPNDPAF